MAAALPLVHAEGIFLEGVGGRALIRLLLDGFLEEEAAVAGVCHCSAALPCSPGSAFAYSALIRAVTRVNS